MIQDGQMLIKELLHSELYKTAEWEGLVKSSMALDSLRQANEQHLAASTTGLKSFYLPGGW